MKKFQLLREAISAINGIPQKSQPMAPGAKIPIAIKLDAKKDIKTSTVVLPVRQSQSKRPAYIVGKINIVDVDAKLIV
jgi:hypothetical protein